MTLNRLHEFWSELLAADPSAGPELSLRLVETREDVRLFAAVTATGGLPGLLVELPDSAKPRAFKPLITRAFEMAAPALTGLSSGRWALFLELKDRSFLDLFEMLADDVIDSARRASGAIEVLKSINRCVGRWRRFVERRAEPLSEEEVRGLIGELVVLSRCVRRFGPEVALAAWTGPNDGLRDFELPDASVEVKTFQGDSAATVLIAPPDQLDTIAERPVYLCAVRLTPSESQGVTLADFVARVAAVIGDEPSALNDLEDRLATGGYLPAHAPLYLKRFVAGPVLMYAVTPRFPRIRSADVPPGVVNVHFAISLSALDSYKADAVPLIGDRASETEAIQ